ncbi:hypothetical protein VTK73DRAFT_7965 [Phialemonium thermophilum]|uniref:Xylanolytic transcriptional activator regulatory domain-containing protein n=1 Tax=Phialemonium thermophilum TaxID=223376 RepID=A0ABR3WBL8_9PEZI
MTPRWTHLIRFLAREDGRVHLGQIDAKKYPDLGVAIETGVEVTANLVEGSMYDGVVTNKTMTVAHLFSPMRQDEVPLIRCMGLNYRDHAKEANMPIPDTPVLFIKPRTALNGPAPATINVPQIAQDGSSDYEAELSLVISKTGRDIPKEEALDYVLGYTCSNDVSARAQQFKNSQWCFSKGLDGSCPVGPVLVAPSAIKDPHNLAIRAVLNGQVVQDSNTREMIFDIPTTISFLSQGTTLERGTIIMTGTGPGIGAMRHPKLSLRHGDDMRVEIDQIGTLVNKVYYDDRTFPHCSVCRQTGQTCNYPSGPKKPGPKIGTLQRQRRHSHVRPPRRHSHRAAESSSASTEPSHTDADIQRSSPRERDGTWDDGHDRLAPGESKSPPNGKHDEWAERQRDSRLNINDISFILHPSHEASTPENDAQAAPARIVGDQDEAGLIRDSCARLGVSQDLLRYLVQVYFEYMVAINLFHQPSFADKVRRISSPVELCALLAAMMGYAVRFRYAEISEGPQTPLAELGVDDLQSPEHYVELAQRFIDQALADCGDEPPSLCVLQACIVATHCQLTRGVHGRAWRSLGLCVRLAYELNLHLVDTRGAARDHHGARSTQWRDAEEKRRVWWAIWEMDVFASTIRRTPTAIDWAQMETLLPVDDAVWFEDRPSASTFMERDPIQRWRALEESGNQSPKAWFLVINSLMKDAQIISSPRGVSFQSDLERRENRREPSSGKRKGGGLPRRPVEESRQKLETLANAVQCFVLALPPHLRYRNQFLSFEGPAPARMDSLRQLHCGIYNIYVMTQLARLMIHRYELFGGPAHQKHHPAADQSPEAGGSTQASSWSGWRDPHNPAVAQYFEAADNILTIASRSCEEHVQHINPFLGSTLWLAAAVQLVRRHVGWCTTSPALIKSRFDVLYLTYKRSVEFWNTKTAMEQNLEALEMRLEGHRVDEDHQRPSPAVEAPRGESVSSAREGTSWISEGPQAHPSFATEIPVPSASTGSLRTPRLPPSSTSQKSSAPAQGRLLPDTPPASIVGDDGAAPNSSPPQNGVKPASVGYFGMQMDMADGHPKTCDAPPHSDLTEAHFMPRPNGADMPDLTSSLIDPGLYASPMNALNMDDMRQRHLDWPNLDLPVDIQDLLSGFSSY